MGDTCFTVMQYLPIPLLLAAAIIRRVPVGHVQHPDSYVAEMYSTMITTTAAAKASRQLQQQQRQHSHEQQEQKQAWPDKQGAYFKEVAS